MHCILLKSLDHLWIWPMDMLSPSKLPQSFSNIIIRSGPDNPFTILFAWYHGSNTGYTTGIHSTMHHAIAYWCNSPFLAFIHSKNVHLLLGKICKWALAEQHHSLLIYMHQLSQRPLVIGHIQLKEKLHNQVFLYNLFSMVRRSLHAPWLASAVVSLSLAVAWERETTIGRSE